MTERLATAEWADPVEFARTHRYRPGDFWLGRSITPDAEPLGCSDDRHICLVSGSRGGKGTTSIINNLCLWPGSLVVIDPKGENASVTARRRGSGSEFCEGLGQKVHVLDPFGTARLEESYRSRFNPLDALDPNSDRTVSEASRIADALVPVQNQKEPFWEQRARSLVHGLILHVLTSPEFAGERHLLTVRKLILRGDWKAVELFRQAGEEKIPPAQHILWNSVRCNPAFEVLAGIGERFLDMAIQAAEQFEGVIDAAVDATRFLDEPEMKRCLETSDFRLSDLKTDPKGVTIYLCLPQYFMNSHSGWLRMMIALTVYEMQVLPDWPACGHRVLLCLDEFAGLKRMDIIEDTVAQIAGFGVKLFIVLQSLEQLKGTYEKKWETFLANCGLKIFFDLGEQFSREYVSKFIGETEVVRQTRTTNESVSQSNSTTHGETRGTSRTVSTSRSGSVSSSEGTSESISKGKNWGGTRNHGWSTGTSEGENWKPHPLFFRNTDRYFSLFRKDESANLGTNRSRSGGGGKNWGGNSSRTTGTSETLGTSFSETEGTSFSDNQSTNDSTTHGSSESTSHGTNEGIHKRPLITPDEIGRHFSRIEDPNDPRQPGFALVLISGQNPLPVRRANYFQEPELDALFDPHPQHPETAPPKLLEERPLLAPSQDILELFQIPGAPPPQMVRWLVAPGTTVAKGQVLFGVTGVRGHDHTPRALEDFQHDPVAYQHWRDTHFTSDGQPLFLVPATASGVLAKIEVSHGPLRAGESLATLIVNRRQDFLARRALASETQPASP